MEFITVILATLLLFILPVIYITKSGYKRWKFAQTIDMIPGPKAYPLVGNALELRVPRNQIFKTLEDRNIRFKNKGIYRVWMGSIPNVIIKKAEHAEIVMSSMKHNEKSEGYKFIHPWLGQGLLTSNGDKWHAHRKMITPTFHFNILESFCDVFVEKSAILVDKLRNNARNNVTFDVYPFITYAALDIICDTAMGVSVNAQNDTENSYVKALYDVSEITIRRVISPWLHSNFIFKLTSIGRKYYQNLDILHGFTNKVIKDRKIQRREKPSQVKKEEDDLTFGRKKRLAFLDLLLDAEVRGRKLDDVELREEVDTFMFEGHDTTTAGICWTLFLLGSHPEIQEKVYAELEEVFHGDDRLPNTRDLGELKYLERVIKESLRLYPSVPFIGRRITEDAIIDGHFVPKGCMASIQIFHIHRDPRYFPDPEKFDPDNFLPERAQGRHPYAYIPFSAGPRNCIGQKFALLEEKAVLAAILREYKLTSMEKREDLVVMSELILRPESGIQLKLEQRNKTK